jgi:hypothetical protein
VTRVANSASSPHDMALAMSFDPATLFETCRTLFGTTQEGLGKLLGVSRRTAQRWANTGIPGYYLIDVARLVHPRDPALARAIVTALGTTLEAQGLVLPAPAPSPLPPAAPTAPDPPGGIVDAVVCAAAEAMDMLPGEVRPGLLAAFARAKEIGLTVDLIERVLRSKLRGGEPTAAASETQDDAGALKPSRRSNAVDQPSKGKRLETRR